MTRTRPRIALPLMLCALLLSSSCGSLSRMNILGGASTAEYKAAHSTIHHWIVERDTALTRGQTLCATRRLTELQCHELAVADVVTKRASVKAQGFDQVWLWQGGRRADKPRDTDKAIAAQADEVGKLIAIIPAKELEP